MTESKIGFDCRYIKPDSQDGISRFSKELFSALSNQLKLTAIISDLRQLESLPAGIDYVRINKPTSVWEPLAAIRLNKHKFDVVFSPMQTIGSFAKKFKLILTIHDLIYYSHPKPPSEFNLFIRLLWRVYHSSFLPQKLLLRGADAVVTVSETSKKLLLEKKLTDKPITVIPNASNNLQAEVAPIEKKLVYMGSFMPYKNVDELIRGMSLVSDYKLVLLSRISGSQQQQLEELAKSLNVNVEFANGVTDEEYVQQLSSATALVHASSEEGFGIPIIEAMSVGCPVVCSDIPIFREIAGDAGLFFEIGDHQQFANQVIKAHHQRQSMSQRLIAQSNLFSWQNSAEKLAKLLS